MKGPRTPQERPARWVDRFLGLAADRFTTRQEDTGMGKWTECENCEREIFIERDPADDEVVLCAECKAELDEWLKPQWAAYARSHPLLNIPDGKSD